MSKVYKRTENGVTTLVSLKEGSAEMTHAQTDGKRHVREMSAGSTGARITYRDGRRVLLLKVDAPQEESAPAAEPEHCVSVRGGAIHTNRPTEDEAWPLCRTGGQDSTGTHYTVTRGELTCRNCLAQESYRTLASATR
ncbi:hypothetical protein [Streptomyces sp. NPDC058674]|uniref:hypothetical protein n=1 Tax=Streptomyces sp. NPDC058674 TaxID=3346592 RepID=UPI00365549F2